MKRFLFSLALILSLGIGAIGYPQPDPPIADTTLIESSSGLDIQSEYLVTDLEATALEKVFCLNSEQRFRVSLATIVPKRLEPKAKEKPRDLYVMPKWDYIPISKPPRSISHIS